MSRHQPVVAATADDIATLKQWSAGRTLEARMVERARIVLRCIDGDQAKDIAHDLGVRPNTVADWRDRFLAEGINGLFDRHRSGKPKKYTDVFRNQVLATLELPPPAGQATWDGAAVAAHLNASDDAVWRVLRTEGISLQRQRSWCVSTDPQFAEKAADVIGLYLSPPTDAIVLSIDEKPSIQALERTTGYVQTSDSTIVRGFKSTGTHAARG
jgi:transposase